MRAEESRLVAEILEELERVCLGGTGKSLVETRRAQLLDWALVKAFCMVHGLPPNPRLLKTLAAADDWIHFLAEATSQSYPFSMVIPCATFFSIPFLSFPLLSSHLRVCVADLLFSFLPGRADVVSSTLGGGLGCNISCLPLLSSSFSPLLSSPLPSSSFFSPHFLLLS